jgi:hypothetical protein
MSAGVSRLLPCTSSINAKFILPALTEATDPYWRPIKYSLFPPLGLATLAAYLSPDDHAVIVDEHVEPLTLNDSPDLVLIQVYITNAYRAYKIADHYQSQGMDDSKSPGFSSTNAGSFEANILLALQFAL